MEMRTSFIAGAKACMPTVLGYWSIGFAAGGIGALAGYSVQEIGWLAALLYAGSAQFVFYSLEASGAGIIAITLGVLFVNVRYLLMSSSLSIYFNGKGTLEKFIGGALLTDETFGVASQYGKAIGHLPFKWLLGLNVTAYLNWVIANILGAILANSLPMSLAEGLSFSLTAMFVGLLLLTYFASSTRGRELVAIIVAAAVVLVGFQHINPNLAVLTATIAGAFFSSMITFLKAKRKDTWIQPSS